MKMRLSSITIFALACVGIFLGLYWFLVLPQVRLLSVAQHKLDAANTLTASPLTSTQSLAERQQEQVRLTNQAETLLPVEGKQYDLSIELEAAAKNANLTIQALTLNTGEVAIPKTKAAEEENAAAGTLKKVAASMSVSGSYENVQRWTLALVRLDRFLTIDSLTVTTAPTTPGLVTAQIAATAYYTPATP